MATIVSVDLGGTGVKGALLMGDVIVRRDSCPTDITCGLASIRASLCCVIDSLIGSDTTGIAVATAGDVDPYAGRVVYATDNLPGFTGFAISDYLSDRYGLPCAAINDAHAALLGEMRCGAGVGKTRCAMLTLGTGVGGAYYNGRIEWGDDFRANRFGHLTLREGGLPCNCGKRGCIEQYVSATALRRRMKDTPYPDTKRLFSAYGRGERAAEEVVTSYLADLADAVRAVRREADFERMILGGGLSGSADLWLPQLRAQLPGVDVAAAFLGNDAGVYGARCYLEERL